MKIDRISSAVKVVTNSLNKQEKRKLSVLVSFQLFSSFLDLIGVALIGVIGAISISGVASQRPGNRVYELTSIIGLQGKPLQVQVIFLSIATVSILLLKTIIAMTLTKQTLLLLSNKSAELTTQLFSKRLSLNILKVQALSSQQTLYGLTNSLVALVVGVFGSGVTIISDSFLTALLIGALFVVDPLTAAISSIIFGSIGILTFIKLGKKSQLLGIQNSELEVASSELVLQSLEAFRETLIGNRQKYYIDSLRVLRNRNASVLATAGFLPHISKYIIEGGVVLGAFILSALQFYLHDAFHAIATLTVFLAAGSRIAPAILRLQQSGILIKNSLGLAETALEMLSEPCMASNLSNQATQTKPFAGSINLLDVTLKYPNSNDFALKNINLRIDQGDFVAIVGPSGGGKSTLVDTILGVLEPTIGEVELSGVNPLTAHKTWPGKTAYVPQQITIFDLSLAQNVALGVPIGEIDLKLVNSCLEQAQLSELGKSRNGLDFELGERGNKLSGGQRQRIGIARALYTNPRLIILDEATSSLDVETEKAISDSIISLKKNKTIVVIAHRLSTIRNADIIHYIEGGTILASGSLDELKKLVPAFDRQAFLSGL